MKAALRITAEFAVALLLCWGTIKALEAVQPGPWIVPDYGTWIE